MKLVKKKWLAMVLAAVMLVGSVGVGTTFAIVNPYISLFDAVYEPYLKSLSATDVIAINAALVKIYGNREMLKDEIIKADNLNGGYLNKYEFDEEVYNNIFQWIDDNKLDIQNMLNKIVADDSIDSLEKIEYANEMQTMASELWSYMPQKFKDRVNQFADDPTKRVAIMNNFVTEIVKKNTFGTATQDASLKYALVLNTSQLSDVEIKTFIFANTDVPGTDQHMASVRAVSNAVLTILNEETMFMADQNVIQILIDNKLVSEVKYSGGGGGPIILPPPVLPPVVGDIPTPEKPLDVTPNPDATYTSLPMREASQLINTPVVTPAQADPVLESLKKEGLSGQQDIVETLQIAERATELVEKLLDNASVTNEDAVKYVNQILSQFIAPAIVKDSSGATHHELDAQAAELVEMLLERVGAIPAAELITEAMVKAADAAQDEALLDIMKSLSAILTSSEISSLSRNISVEAVGTTAKVDPAAVAFLKQSNLGIRVDSGTVHLTLTADIVKTLRSDQILTVDLAPKSTNGLSTTNGGSKVVVGGAYKLSVYLTDAQGNVTETLSNIQPMVSLPLGGFRTGLHTVGAYYYNETTEAWEYIRSQVINNRVVFKAPHLSVYGVLQRSVSFTDMTSHWAQAVVEELAAHNIVSGRTESEYAPNGTITRAEFATLLVQALQLKGDIKVTFNDVYTNDWYYQYVNVAALHGLVSGVGSGQFDPNANITRQDMAIMIMKAYEKRIGTSVKSVAVEIKDLSTVSQYAKDRVLAARFNQLIGGYPDGTFKPLANATRAEAAQMVGNLLSK